MEDLQKNTIHVCLVSEQALANLIPILQYRPERIALVVTGGKGDWVKRFSRTLGKAGWSEESIDVYENCPVTDYNALIDYAMAVEDEVRQSQDNLALTLNVTGGTKLMAFAFYDVFTAGDEPCEVIYTDTAQQRFVTLNPRERGMVGMKPVIDLDLYFYCEGKTLRKSADQNTDWVEGANQRKPLTKFLASKRLQDFMGIINKHVGGEQSADHVEPLRFNNARGDWKKALEHMQANELLDDCGNGEWRIKSNEALRYITGAWLEEYAWHTARDALRGYDVTVAASVEVTDNISKEEVRNELDLVVLFNNKLLVIECKTGTFKANEGANAPVYKLNSLAGQVGGAMGKGLLLSYRPLDHRAGNNRRVNVSYRAQSFALDTLDGENIKHLGDYIKKWAGVAE